MKPENLQGHRLCCAFAVLGDSMVVFWCPDGLAILWACSPPTSIINMVVVDDAHKNVRVLLQSVPWAPRREEFVCMAPDKREKMMVLRLN